jgi:hypothetical protein
VETDPQAAERVRRDAEFLEVVRAAAPLRPVPSDLLEPRVRRALAADRAAGFPSTGGGEAASRRRRLVATAATVLLAGGLAWMTVGRVSETAAADRRAVLAAEAYRDAERGTPVVGTTDGPACGERAAASPHRFPPVSMGDFEIQACTPVEEEDASVSILRREGGEQDLRGLVVAPWDGKSTSTDVGYTRFDDDVVVFDVTIGGAKYYLATRWSAVYGKPACIACHGAERAGKPNPHHFVRR